MGGVFDPQWLTAGVFFATIVLGLEAVAVYAYRSSRSHTTFQESDLILIFLHAGGLESGVFLMLITLHNVITSTYTPLPLPAFIGGTITAVVCTKGLHRDLFSAPYHSVANQNATANNREQRPCKNAQVNREDSESARR